MALTITLDLPDKIEANAQHTADQTQRSLAEVLLTWLDRAAEELPVSELSDEQILSLTKLQMDEASQSELSELLAQNREDSLGVSSRQRLDQLMCVYRYNLVRKAEAFKVATERRLIPPLNTFQSTASKIRTQDFREWVTGLPQTDKSLSDDAFDRENIYE